VLGVGRNERSIERERMSRNGCVEILNPGATAFQGGLDAAEDLADCIAPLGSWSSAAIRSNRDCRVARRLDRGRRSMPKAISASTGWRC
jgi:hypothetical protein